MMARLSTWWDARAPRERWLALGAALVIGAAGVDTLLLAPQRAEQARVTRELVAARDRLAKLQELAARQSAADDDAQRAHAAALRARREQAERVIREAQIDLIAPREMGQQLATILARFPALRVVGVMSGAPKPFPPPPADANGNGTNANGASNAALSAAPSGGLYQHGLEVQIEGRYLDLLAYVEALERAPRRVYWRELEMKVNADGVPVTRLALFTLSKETTWLRL
jgi:MSHA biogenesis protein MshJ